MISANSSICYKHAQNDLMFSAELQNGSESKVLNKLKFQKQLEWLLRRHKSCPKLTKLIYRKQQFVWYMSYHLSFFCLFYKLQVEWNISLIYQDGIKSRFITTFWILSIFLISLETFQSILEIQSYVSQYVQNHQKWSSLTQIKNRNLDLSS